MIDVVEAFKMTEKVYLEDSGMFLSFSGMIYLSQLQDAIKQGKATKLQRWGFWLFYICVFIVFAIVLCCLK